MQGRDARYGFLIKFLCGKGGARPSNTEDFVSGRLLLVVSRDCFCSPCSVFYKLCFELCEQRARYFQFLVSEYATTTRASLVSGFPSDFLIPASDFRCSPQKYTDMRGGSV